MLILAINTLFYSHVLSCFIKHDNTYIKQISFELEGCVSLATVWYLYKEFCNSGRKAAASIYFVNSPFLENGNASCIPVCISVGIKCRIEKKAWINDPQICMELGYQWIIFAELVFEFHGVAIFVWICYSYLSCSLVVYTNLNLLQHFNDSCPI